MRISIAGFGAVCEKAHIPAIKDISKFKISGVYDLSDERLKAVKSLIGVNAYSNLDEMIDKEKPDCLLVSTPPSSHKDIIIKALDKGINVICEKPLCTKLSDFDEISDASRANDRIVFTVHNWKYAPAISKMIEISKEIAPIKYISWHTLRKMPSVTAGSQWRTNPDISGGGIIFDHGWHVFYILKEITQSEFLDVSPRFAFDDKNIDKVCDLRILYQNGAIANVHLSWESTTRKNSCLCYGKNGWFEFLDDRIVYETPTGDGVYVFDEKLSSSSAHPSWTYNLYLDFLKALDNRKYAEANLKEAAECIRIIEFSYIKSSLKVNL